MLTLYATDIYSQQEMKQLDLHPDSSFDYEMSYRPELLDHEFARRVITDIDRVNVMDMSKSTSRILLENGLRPQDLATGTKNVILQKERPGWWCRMGFMGENCYKYLMEASDEVDIKGVFVNVLNFSDEDIVGHVVYFEQLGRYARDLATFRDCISSIILGHYFDTEEAE